MVSDCEMHSVAEDESVAATESEAVRADDLAGEPTTSPKMKVRPIQMGEFVRKYMTRHLLLLDRRRLQCSMVSATQWGVGTPGGGDAIIHTHYSLEELFFAGALPRSLAVIQVDQRTMFGNLEWKKVREAIKDEVPNLAASTAWKHTRPSEVEQPGIASAEKDHGAGQGDVAGPLEAGSTQAAIARCARMDVHIEQWSGSLRGVRGTMQKQLTPQ